MVVEKRKRRCLVPAGAVLVILTGTVAGVWYFGRRERWDWGDVPTWVGAIATVAALGAACVGAFFAFRQLGMLRDQVRLQDDALKLQMEQLRADHAEAERRAIQELKLLKIAARRQAEQVVLRSNFIHTFLDNAPYQMMLTVQLNNESPRPIRNVAARVDMKPYSRKPYGQADSNSKSVSIHRLPLSPLSLIRGGESVHLVFPIQRLHSINGVETYALWALEPDERIANEMLPGDQMSDPVIGFVARFTDDAVQHWELTDDMHLEQIPDRSDW